MGARGLDSITISLSKIIAEKNFSRLDTALCCNNLEIECGTPV
jgi:hypothetical protein